MNNIRKNFKHWRTNNKLTTLDIERITGISNSSISAIERGRNLPSLKLLIPLTQHFNLSLDELIDNKNKLQLTNSEIELLDKFKLLPEREQYKLLARIDLILEDLEFKNKLGD